MFSNVQVSEKIVRYTLRTQNGVMEMNKKLISIFLAVIMLVTAVPMTAFAKEESYPVVINSGYSSSQIFMFDDEGNIDHKVWGLDVGGILTKALKDIPYLTAANLEYFVSKNPDKIYKQICKTVNSAVDEMKRNPDGTPKYNTGAWPTKPEESNMKYVYDNLETNEYIQGTIHEKRYTPILCEKIGAENVFQFSTDWRQEIILCARDLGKYIKSVLDYTGAKKVNIFSESHGGQTTGTFISLCSIVDKGGEAAEKLASLLGMKMSDLKTIFNLDYVNNAVMNSPAIGGVQIAYDIISGQMHADITRILEFYEYANNPLYEIFGGDEYMWEAEYEWLIAFAKLDKTNGFLNKIIQNDDIMYNIVLTFGSLWDFVDTDHYEEVKASKLNTPERQAAFAPIIKNTDYSHYYVMPYVDENLSYARSKGVNVNIVCGTDITPATGSPVNSDCLVATKTASGAKVADYGYRFSNGYTTDVKDPIVNCTNKAHNHVSPGMNVDAAYGYLPENTWYIEGQFHAQYAFDSYALALTDKLLLTKDLTDVHSDANFPQFETTYNAKCGVHAKFDKSLNGRASEKDTALIIENLSKKSGIELVSIKVEGSDIAFENVAGKKISIGEKISLPITGSVKEKGMTNFTVTIYYLEDNSLFSIDSRRFNFSVDNTELANYDASKPLTKAKTSPVYISSSDISETLSNYDFSIQIKAIILSMVHILTTVVEMIKKVASK